MRLEVEKIGGIVSGTVEIQTGLNIVRAENFAGKTSLIRSIETVMGVGDVDGKSLPLLETADRGFVALDDGEVRSEVIVESENGVVTQAGKPAIENEKTQVLAHLFAILGEQNPIRVAVEQRDNDALTELLQQPLEIEDIEDQIREEQTKRNRVQEELESLEQKIESLPALESELSRIETEIADLKERREELGKQLAETESADEKLRAKLRELRSEKSQIDGKIQRLETEINTRTKELAERKEERESVRVPDEPEVTTQIKAAQERIESINSELSLLEDVYRANNAVLETDSIEIVSEIAHELSGDVIECWVCGNDTDRQSLEEAVEQLDELRSQLQSEKLNEQKVVTDLRDERDAYQSAKELDKDLAEEIQSIEMAIEQKTAELEQAKESVESIDNEIAKLEAERIDASDNEQLEAELSSIEQKIGMKEREKDDVEQQLKEAEEAEESVEKLRAKLNGIRGRIKQLRGRRTNKQEQLATEFSGILDNIISKIGPGFDGGRLVVKRQSDGSLEKYELVIARDGREVPLHHLSESELTLVGFSVALAGFETFNLGNRLDMMLLDSVSELSERSFKILIEFIANECDIETVVATTHPEVADDDLAGNIIEPKMWTAISDVDRSDGDDDPQELVN